MLEYFRESWGVGGMAEPLNFEILENQVSANNDGRIIAFPDGGEERLGLRIFIRFKREFLTPVSLNSSLGTLW